MIQLIRVLFEIFPQAVIRRMPRRLLVDLPDVTNRAKIAKVSHQHDTYSISMTCDGACICLLEILWRKIVHPFTAPMIGIIIGMEFRWYQWCARNISPSFGSVLGGWGLSVNPAWSSCEFQKLDRYASLQYSSNHSDSASVKSHNRLLWGCPHSTVKLYTSL